MMANMFERRRLWLAAALLGGLLLLGALLAALAAPASAERGPLPETMSRLPAASAASASGAAPAAPDGELIPAPPPVEARPAAGALPIRTLMPIARWLKPGEYAWDDDAAPAGPVTVVVDVRARTLSVYRQGMEIGRSSIIYGADNKPTPLGTFSILMKKADHYSRTYDNAPMPFTLRLTEDGVAIHGAEIADDVGTHGCVGLPIEFAELLFAQAELGGKVIIVGGPPGGGDYTSYAALPYGAGA